MMLIDIDPHEPTHTATAVDPEANRDHASIRMDMPLQEYQRMLDWARQRPRRRWGVENARGMGRHVTPRLFTRGEQVVDPSPSATARVRLELGSVDLVVARAARRAGEKGMGKGSP